MINDDIERRLRNWADWHYSGRSATGGGAAISSIYKAGPRGRRAGSIMPVINGEALDTDAAVNRMPVDLRNVLRAHYLRVSPSGRWLGTLSAGRVAEAIGCARSTLASRLDLAHQALRMELDRRWNQVKCTQLQPDSCAKLLSH